MVHVLELSTGANFKKRIPDLYHPQLTWITRESKEKGPSSKWLQNVMDCFAEELRSVQEFSPTWRSTSLNSLLMRRFYSIPHGDPKRIAVMVNEIVQAGGRVTIKHWIEFYTGLDVISREYFPEWALKEPGIFGEHQEGSMEKGKSVLGPSEQVPGTVILLLATSGATHSTLQSSTAR